MAGHSAFSLQPLLIDLLLQDDFIAGHPDFFAQQPLFIAFVHAASFAALHPALA